MLMKLINRRVEICRMLYKKSEGAAHLAAVLYMDAIKIAVNEQRKKSRETGISFGTVSVPGREENHFPACGRDDNGRKRMFSRELVESDDF